MKTKFLVLLTALLCSAALTNAQLIENWIGTPSADEITNCEIVDNTSAAGAALVHVGYDNMGNALITKTTTNGAAIFWQKKLPGSSTNPYIFYEVIMARHTPADPNFSNGDYIVVGQQGGSLFFGNNGIICRYSNAGVLLASQVVIEPLWGLLFTGVCELQTGDIVAVGYDNQPGVQNAFIHSFTYNLGLLWSHQLSNPLPANTKSIFLSVICDAATIYAVGNTDNNLHTAYDGTVTRFNYAGGFINAQLYDLSYSYTGYTLNSMWFLKPILLSTNHLAIWTTLSNWVLVADDAAIVDINNVTFAPTYTSIHSPTSVFLNGQGITSFKSIGVKDFLFTIAPGTSQYDVSSPNNPPFPPAVVRVTGGALNFAKQINDPTRDYGLFALELDAANIYSGGFTDIAPGGQKDILTLEAAGWIFGGSCPTKNIPLDIQSQSPTWSNLYWNINPPGLTYQQLQDVYNQMPDINICQGPCTAPCPSMLTLTVVDHDGFPCTFDGTVVAADSNSCWQAYSYQWSLCGTTVTNFSSYFSNTQTLPIPVGSTCNMQVIVTFVDAVGDTCRDTLAHDGLWCNGGHAGGRLVNGHNSSASPAGADLINIYPNPSSGNINIEDNNGMISNVQVIDITGKVLATYNNINQEKTSISLASYSPGSYIIKVNNDRSYIVNKIE